MGEATLYSLVIVIPLLFVLVWPYRFLWGDTAWVSGVQAWLDRPFWLFAVLVLGTMAHELLHGLTWVYAAGKPHTAIKYGFQLKTLTPYAHCSEPMEIGPYRWGALMPGLVLGFVPAVAGIFFGHLETMGFGLFFTLAAGGDLLILWVLRNVKRGQFVLDHPERAGCIVFASASV